MIFKFSKLYILDILNRPEHHMDHTKKYSASVTLSLTYGKVTPTLLSDPEVHALNMLVCRLGDCLRIGAYFVETFPFLQYLPIPEVKKLQQYHHEELALFKEYIKIVRENLSNEKTLPQNFSAYLIDSQDHLRLSDNELAYLAGTVFEAGSDTTASAMSFIVMAAACFPSEVLKVQEQLDAVVGRSRVPNFEDEEHLPLVTAFYQEAHRWRPIGPSGFAHRATKDIHWNDFVIPAGTTVVGNHWSVLHDPEAFPDPERFELCRWLDKNGHLKNTLKMYGFGFGRRACPGQVVAERSLFINTALLLWSFQITEDPSTPIDTMGFTDGPVARPFPFKAIFEPRIEALAMMLQ